MDKRDFYLKESLKLFLKHGIKKVTVGDITSHLNISSKTLYAIFGDKLSLAEAAFQLYLHNAEHDFNTFSEKTENVADMLVQFSFASVESISRVHPAFFHDLAHYFPNIWDEEEAFGIQFTRALIERGIEEGIFVRAMDRDLCAKTLVWLLRAVVERQEILQQTPQALWLNVLWPYVRGLCTEQGLRAFREARD